MRRAVRGQRCICWLVTLFAIALLSGKAAARSPSVKVTIAPAPAWVDPEPDITTPEPAPSGGISVLAVDLESRCVGSTYWRFVRGMIKITSQLGIQGAGERRFQFVPPNERLVLHRLEIRREGRAISRLTRSAIRILEREPGLEQNVYDGTRTAVIVLPDLRVGDSIVYEYSVVGQNPVLDGHVMDAWSEQWSTAVGRLRYRLITDRPIYIKIFAHATAPEDVERGALLHELRWEGRNLPAAPVEDSMPADYDVAPWVQLTDFGSWREVADWGSAIFRGPTRGSKLVDEALTRIRQQTKLPEERVLAVLDLVQTEVRYLSLAFDQSTHRPADPNVVLERRFGDCKDKSLLAVTLLRALGFDASVALVNTTRGLSLPELLPTIHAFDHAVVSVAIEGRQLFLDPTRLFQHGSLWERAARGFHHALVLAPGEYQLTPISEPRSSTPDVWSLLRVTIERFGGPVLLDATTIYTGDRADSFRALRASASEQDFAKIAATPVTKTFPRAKLVGSPSVSDPESTNEFRITQRFRMDGAWDPGLHSQPILTLFPPALRERLPAVAADRKTPLALDWPLHVVQQIEIQVPEVVPYTPRSIRIDPRPFTFTYSGSMSGRTLTLRYDFQTKSPRVKLASLSEYGDALNKFANWATFTIRAPLAGGGGHWPAGPLLALCMMWSLLVLAGAALVQWRKPYFRRPGVVWDARWAGRRGFLALMGFGVTIAAFVVPYRLWSILPIYSAGSWARLTDQNSPGYRPYHVPLLGVELIAMLTLTLGVWYVAYLYWAKHRSFPTVFVLVQLLSMGLMLVDHFAVNSLSATLATIDSVSNLVALPISVAWCFYAMQSRRVKATFLPPDVSADDEARSAVEPAEEV